MYFKVEVWKQAALNEQFDNRSFLAALALVTN